MRVRHNLPSERGTMFNLTFRDRKARKRIKRLEKQLGTDVNKEAQDVADIKATIDAHNKEDAAAQEVVNQRVTDQEAEIAALKAANPGIDTTALDANLEALKQSVAALPTITVPA